MAHHSDPTSHNSLTGKVAAGVVISAAILAEKEAAEQIVADHECALEENTLYDCERLGNISLELLASLEEQFGSTSNLSVGNLDIHPDGAGWSGTSYVRKLILQNTPVGYLEFFTNTSGETFTHYRESFPPPQGVYVTTQRLPSRQYIEFC